MTSELPILALTEGAARMIRHHLEQREPNHALRLTVREDGPAAFDSKLQLVPEETAAPGDARIPIEDIIVLIDEDSIPNVRGTTLDYVDSLEGRSGFSFDNPNLPPLLRDPVASRVSQLLQEQINPGLAAHGGRARLLDVRDGRVYLEFGGGCQGCGMVDVTLKRGVEAALKAEIPEIREVLDTTDHAAGTNPYYRAEAT